jgi:hypothetical protein
MPTIELEESCFLSLDNFLTSYDPNITQFTFEST